MSHLRFGYRLIRLSYLITKIGLLLCTSFYLFIAWMLLVVLYWGYVLRECSLEREGMGSFAARFRKPLSREAVSFIDLWLKVARREMGSRINTIMQTCFFAISGVLPREQAIEAINMPSAKLMANVARPS